MSAELSSTGRDRSTSLGLVKVLCDSGSVLFALKFCRLALHKSNRESGQMRSCGGSELAAC